MKSDVFTLKIKTLFTLVVYIYSIVFIEMATLARLGETFVELPETQASVIDPETKTISEISLEEVEKILSPDRFRVWCDESNGAYFYSSPDTMKDMWFYQNGTTSQVFHGKTYVVGFAWSWDRINYHYHPPPIHQKYMSNHVHFRNSEVREFESQVIRSSTSQETLKF
jgi:hypothetical protein